MVGKICPNIKFTPPPPPTLHFSSTTKHVGKIRLHKAFILLLIYSLEKVF